MDSRGTDGKNHYYEWFIGALGFGFDGDRCCLAGGDGDAGMIGGEREIGTAEEQGAVNGPEAVVDKFYCYGEFFATWYSCRGIDGGDAEKRSHVD